MSWQKTTLGELINPSKERYTPKSGDVEQKYIGLEHLGQGTGKIIGYGSSRDVVSTKAVFRKGDLLYGKLRPYLNKVAVAPFDGVCSTDILVFSPGNTVLNEFLLLRMIQRDFVEFAQLHSTGVQHPRVKFDALAKFPISIPSRDEQQEIVEKIDELFGEIEFADRALAESKKSMSFYRRLKKSQLVVDQKLPFLPLSRIAERIQVGPFGSQLHKHDYVENGIPLINPANISDGKIIPNLKKSITKNKHAELPMYHLADGDVILGRRGEMGRTALVTKAEDGWFCGTGSIFIRPDSMKIRSAYLSELLSSEYAVTHLKNKAGGTTMSNLNKNILSNFPIPLPSLSQQDEILLEIEALKMELNTMSSVISVSSLKSQTLKQSILSIAFKGELV